MIVEEYLNSYSPFKEIQPRKRKNRPQVGGSGIYAIVWYEGEELPVRDYGGIIVYDYGALFGSIGKVVGSVIHGAGKAIGSVARGVGKVIHYVGKGLKYVAPIAVAAVAGAAVSGILSHFGAVGTTIASASPKAIAAAVSAGNITGALTTTVAFATKVAITNVASAAIMKALNIAPPDQPAVVAAGNKPAIVIPVFVRQLVNTQNLVAYATKNGTIKNSRVIQQRIDWLAQKILYAAKALAQINNQCGLCLTQKEVESLLRNTFYNIPSTQAEIERRVQSMIAKARELARKKMLARQRLQTQTQVQTQSQTRHQPASQSTQQPTNGSLSIPKYIHIGSYKIPTIYAFGGLLLLVVLLSRR